MEEEVEQLPWKKDLTICKGRSTWPAAMEEVAEKLQWKK